ncbi:MAG: glycosyltransferase family 2 protein [Lentimicrobiaceae bacterium]|jgi:cellulose synthase/poly-beta-1,6-N-acetylglucosamine synthase-like glycosyltransferase|nr:glycosyltransferase family 2 protein [Lentimicrobiaceae bacterium]
MTKVEIILNIFQLILFIYLAGCTLYVFIFSVASLFKLKKIKTLDTKQRKIVVLIPCYKEDEIIEEVISDALKQDYPKELFDIVLIADHFDRGTIEKIKQYPIILFDKQFEISTKTRALNYALKQFEPNAYDVVVILDADNLMENNFLQKINKAFSNPYIAIQAHRSAKNLNTNFAVLDAISEEINNNIFRKGQRKLGLSSALIGSAMAFDFCFFKKMMEDVEVVGGFDKELELNLLKERHVIEYLPNAIVLDEKVQNVQVFTKQRRRWLSAQFHFFGKHFFPALRDLIMNGNIDYFNKAIQYIQLPRILLLGILLLISLISIFVNPIVYTILWLSATLLIIITLLLAVPRKFYNFRTVKALLSLPTGVFSMFFSLISIKGANKEFIHTKHTYNAFQIKHKKAPKKE